MGKFSSEYSHDENIKIAIENIIGSKTFIKKAKSSVKHPIKKELFCRLIKDIITSEERSIILEADFCLDLKSYNGIYNRIIENFIAYIFNANQIKIILFYIYDKYTPEGVQSLTDSEGNIVPLETAEDLWNVISTMK